MIGEICGLASALLWAINSIVLKTLMIKIDAIALNLIRCIFASLFFLLLLPLLGRLESLLEIPWLSLVFLLLSVFIGLGVGDTLYYQSMNLIGVSKALPISSIYPLITLVLATFFLGEPFTWRIVMGAVLVIGGIYLISFPPSQITPVAQPSLSPTLHRKGVYFALFASLCWGFSTILLKIGIVDLDTITANAFRMPAAALLLTCMAAFHKGLPQLKTYEKRTLAILGLSGFFGIGIGGIIYLTAVQYAGATKAAIFSSTSPLFAAPLSLIFLKEQISWQVGMGIVLTVVGIWFTV